MRLPPDGMYYDDSSRRLNLLSGLVFGTVLGAGLALLFLPGDGLDGGRRVVVRTARSLGRTARQGARAARGRMDAVRERLREDGRADAGDDDEPEPTRAFGRAKALGRRRFEL